MPTRVAVDAMGGDDAPGVVIAGALRAVEQADLDLLLLLFGPLQMLREEMARRAPGGHSRIELIDAPQIIGMGESPVAAVRAKPHSSMHIGLTYHREGKADAFVSAGNTGAITAASLFVLGRLPGVTRPSIPSYFPSTNGKCLLLDVGSNMDSKPEHLLQYGHLGTAFASCTMDIDEPRVGLLSVGEEPAKGNELVRTAYKLLSAASNINFIGNIEGRDILHHAADVVVCDGFVGNVVLKLAESVMTALPVMVSQEVEEQKLDSHAAQSFKGIVRGLKRRFNPETYGGCAPLLGVDGTVFVAHGSCSARALEQALLLAARTASANLTHAIQSRVHLADLTRNND